MRYEYKILVRRLKGRHHFGQRFSTFVRPLPGNSFFIRQGPGIIDARARWLRNIDLDDLSIEGMIILDWILK
jgi:hypothetical protein